MSSFNYSSYDQNENISSSILVPLIYSLVNKSYSPSNNNNNNNNNNASYEIFSTSILIVLFLLLSAFVFIIQGSNRKNTKNQPRKQNEPDVVSDFSNLEMTDSRTRRTRREAAPPPIYDTLYSA